MKTTLVPVWLRRARWARKIRWVLRWGTRFAVSLLVLASIGIWVYADSVPLPDEPFAPQASEIYFRDGKTLLARVGVANRTDVPLSVVPLEVRHAVLAAEDRGYFDHFGISIRGLARAAWANVAGDSSEGASTITQQYARNAYLTQERSVQRKSKEAVLAVKLEAKYTKDEILERYLNAIYYGRGAYGIAAAAEAYFGVPPDRLTLAQGAVLAAVIKDPWNFDPAVDPVAAKDRWDWIVKSMMDLGWRTGEPVAYPTILPEAPLDTTPGGVNGLIVGLVERELNRVGISPQTLHTAGLRVVSTIDTTAQNAALAAVATGLTGLDKAVHAALVAIDPTTGAVRAYYGGNRGQGFFDDATAPRRPASTFKPLVLAAGLLRGYSYNSLWNGSSPQNFPDRGGVPLKNNDNVQCPWCRLDTSMVLSLNTPFYALAQKLGGNVVRKLALSMGVSPTYDDVPSLMDGKGDPKPGRTRADIAMGIYPVSPIDLADVYTTFASGGDRIQRHVVETVSAGPGATVWYSATPTRTNVLNRGVAADVATVLAKVVNHDGAVPGHPAAGKTGTQQWGDTNDNQDAWMAGYTAQLVAVVWMGKPDPGPIRDAANRPIQGDGLPASIWRGFLTEALRGQPGVPLPTQNAAAIRQSDGGGPAPGGLKTFPTPKAPPTQADKPTTTSPPVTSSNRGPVQVPTTGAKQTSSPATGGAVRSSDPTPTPTPKP